MSEELYQAVEWGILEYKSSIINSALELTESLKYDTAALNRLDALNRKAENTYICYSLSEIISKKAVKLKLKNEDSPESRIKKTEKYC